MTLQQMEYIVALDKYRHFVLAAESCGVTQPTLSALIQKLEEELDVKIFNRDRKQVTPTDIGEKIIRQARTALNEVYRIREVVADETSTTNGNLRIGILPTIAPYLVPDLIHHFRKSFPNVNLFIDEKENESLVKDLELGNIDMAITTLPESSKGLLEIPVYVERFVAYFSEKCSKAQQFISKGEIPAEQIWILKEGHCLPHSGLNLCKNGQFGNHIYQAGSIYHHSGTPPPFSERQAEREGSSATNQPAGTKTSVAPRQRRLCPRKDDAGRAGRTPTDYSGRDDGQPNQETCRSVEIKIGSSQVTPDPLKSKTYIHKEKSSVNH